MIFHPLKTCIFDIAKVEIFGRGGKNLKNVQKNEIIEFFSIIGNF